MNSNVLKGIIVANGDTQSGLAEALEISQSYLNKKINRPDKFEFTLSEIDKIRTRYSLSDAELIRIFFTK